jgi:hypothetical protein
MRALARAASLLRRAAAGTGPAPVAPCHPLPGAGPSLAKVRIPHFPSPPLPAPPLRSRSPFLGEGGAPVAGS